MSKKTWILIGCLVGCGLVVAALFGLRQRNQLIHIGFIGELTGPQASWGIQARDGMQFAIEEVNTSGGIRGSLVEFTVKDLNQYPEHPSRAVEELIEEGVVAIIGPLLSAVAEQVVPYANERRMLLIAPTVSTNTLTGQDDFFIRMTRSNALQATDLATYVFHTSGWNTVAATFDISNRTFTEGYYQAFKERFEQLGGSVELAHTFSSGSGYPDVARQLAALSPDGMLILANSVDTAAICQELRKLGITTAVAGSGWGMTDELIRHGGMAVEGMLFISIFFYDDSDEQFQAFATRYRERMGNTPSFPVTYSYDATNVLIEALKQSDEWTPDALKHTILRLQHFSSPLGVLEIDDYGDAVRPITIVSVKEGQFVKIQ
jgi:branched-chain amino acid transport system substrate-binding protein